MNKAAAGLFVLTLGLMLQGCDAARDSLSQNLKDLAGDPRPGRALAAEHGFEIIRLPTDSFVLTAFSRGRGHSGAMTTLYIEDDGFVWTQASGRGRPEAEVLNDPTPKSPLALQMAVSDPAAMVYVLARPCQYARDLDWRGCAFPWWNDLRFSAKAVQSMSQAMDELKAQGHIREFRLIGARGGGIMATLLAAERTDVRELITAAAPLSNVLPPETASRLGFVRQIHFAGENDVVAPVTGLDAFVGQLPGPAKARTFVTLGTDHICCWAEKWPELLRTAEAVLSTP